MAWFGKIKSLNNKNDLLTIALFPLTRTEFRDEAFSDYCRYALL
jgi:hypothetical protein